MATFQLDFTVEPTEMMAREANVQARAEARHLRVILSGWGGDDAVTCRARPRPGFQRDTSSPGTSLLLSARRLAGTVRDLVLVNLPDSLYALILGNALQAHTAPCVQPAFSRHYRDEVKALRGSAPRRLPAVRTTICRLLEGGQLSLRAEDWEESGARHGLVYRYPMLDRRLVEFALGIPPHHVCQIDRRRSLFQRAVGELLPSAADWQPVKNESATFAALGKEQIQAYSDWDRRLASEKAASWVTTFVDPARIRKAVQSGIKSGRLRDLSGVREAFGCYAINSRLIK
jgi:asparagine synthase (glutamine-hydrolysing)